MKNDLIELILNRHSYRGKYKATPVPKEDLALIMEAGLVCVLPVGIAETDPKGPKKKPFGERAWFNGFEQ